MLITAYRLSLNSILTTKSYEIAPTCTNFRAEGLKGLTYKVGGEVEFVELVSRLQQAGNQAGHQDLLPQLVDVCGSSLTAGHLHRPLVCVCYNADGLSYGLIQNWMLQRTEMIIHQ